ncbi:MAG: hypothetical protein ACXW2U_00745 [Telluria sp.]
MGILTMIIPALVPALSDGLRSVIGKLTGSAGAQPQNVTETIQLMEAQTARVQALAELDKLPDGAAPWVINMRGSFRYLATGGIVLSAIAGTYMGVSPAFLILIYDMAGASMSFIIGERMYIKIRGADK